MSRHAWAVVVAAILMAGCDGGDEPAPQWPPATWDGTWTAEASGAAVGDPATACDEAPALTAVVVEGTVVHVRTSAGEMPGGWVTAVDQEHAKISTGENDVSGWYLADAQLARCDFAFCGTVKWTNAPLDRPGGAAPTASCTQAFTFRQEL